MDYLPALDVAEGEVIDLHVAAHIRRDDCALRVGRFGLLFEHAEYALGRGYGRLEFAEHVGDFVYGARKFARIEHERGHLPDARYAAEGVHIHQRAEHGYEREREVVHKIVYGAGHCGEILGLGIGVNRVGVFVFKLVDYHRSQP